VAIVRPGAQIVDVHVEQPAITGLADERDIEHVEERREDRDDVDAHGFESRHPIPCFRRVTTHPPQRPSSSDADVTEK
jgi:hypothetical protein